MFVGQSGRADFDLHTTDRIRCGPYAGTAGRYTLMIGHIEVP